MKNIKYLIVIGLLSALILTTIFFIIRKDNHAAPRLNDNAVSDVKKEVKAVMWDNYVPYIVEDDYKQLPLSTKFKDTSSNSFTLEKILSKKYLLVIRYSYVDCDLCVNEVMKRIKQLNGNFPLKYAVGFMNTNSERDFLIRSRENKYPITIYDIGGTTVGLFMENKNFPFLFVLTPEGRAIKIFTPARENPEQITDYLKKTLQFVNEQNLDAKI